MEGVFSVCCVKLCRTKVSNAPLRGKDDIQVSSFWWQYLPLASPIHHFWRNIIFLRHECLSSVHTDATPARGLQIRVSTRFPDRSRLLSSPLSSRDGLDVEMLKREERLSVRLSQGCCPCSLGVWGTVFASAESATRRRRKR